jgi:hypothetical protein
LFHRFEEFMVCLCCFDRDCLLAKDALGARAESLQGLRALAASNPAAAKDYVAAIEAQRAEALSRHLAGIAPGLNATNDQVIDYMGKSAQARARLGEVTSPDQPQAGAAVTSAGAHVTTANTGKAAQASTAGVNQATAKHLGAQTAGLQQDQDTTTALGTPADKRTEIQNTLAAAAEAKLAAKQNTPEKLSAARKSADT